MKQQSKLVRGDDRITLNVLTKKTTSLRPIRGLCLTGVRILIITNTRMQ